MGRSARWVLGLLGVGVVGCGGSPEPVEMPADLGVSVCGDGVVDPEEEECDLGFANGPSAPCLEDCTLAPCGDGVVQYGEHCDDGVTCSLDCEAFVPHEWDLTFDSIGLVRTDREGRAIVTAATPVGTEDTIWSVTAVTREGQIEWKVPFPALIQYLDVDEDRILVAANDQIVSPPQPRLRVLDPDGGIVAEYLHDPADAQIWGMAPSDEGAYLLAWTYAGPRMLVALDSNYEVRWQQELEPSFDFLADLWVHPEGGVVVGRAVTPVILQRYGADGEWLGNTPVGAVFAQVEHLIFDPTGGFITGSTFSTKPSSQVTETWLRLTRHGPDGELLWERRESMHEDPSGLRSLQCVDRMGELWVASGTEVTVPCGQACQSRGWVGLYTDEGRPVMAWMGEEGDQGYCAVGASADEFYLVTRRPGGDQLSLIRPRLP